MNNEQTINQTKIQKLNDDQLVKYLDKLFSYERKLNQVIILALGEIQERRLYAYLGYASLFEMLVKHFKLSETAAYQRLNTLKLIKAVPEVHNMIENGNLSLTNAAMAQSVIQKIEKTDDKKLTVHEKQEIVQLVCNKTQKQAQIALTEIHPVASLPKTIEKPITVELTQIQVLLNKETYENLQTLKSLYSHKIPDGDLNKLFELVITSAVQNHQLNKQSRKNGLVNNGQNINVEMIVNSLVDIKTEKPVTALTGENQMNNINQICDADLPVTQTDPDNQTFSQECGFNHNENNNVQRLSVKPQLNDPNVATASKLSNSNSTKTSNRRYVRLYVKRNIYQRANGQCEFINEQGHRCQSRHQLEFDHVQSISHDGDSEIDNIQLLCRYHNQFKVNHTHGFLFKKTKI